MKYVLYVVAIVSLFWGWAVNGGFWSASSFLITSYAAVFWGTALIYLYDFLMAFLGKNSVYMAEFYGELQNDLIASVVVGFTLAFLFLHTHGSYSLSNIDIAGSGLPFFVVALIETIRCAKLKVANRALPKWTVAFFVAIQAFAYLIATWALSYVLDGKVSSARSVWIQVTIVCAGLTFFFGSKQIRFILLKGKMEPSPVLLDLFRNIPDSPGFYKDIEIGAKIWNAEVKKEKATIRKKSDRRRRKGRR